MRFLPFAIFAEFPEHFCAAFVYRDSLSMTNVHRKSVLIPRPQFYLLHPDVSLDPAILACRLVFVIAKQRPQDFISLGRL